MENNFLKITRYVILILILFPILVDAGELHLEKGKHKYKITPVVHYLIDQKNEMNFEDIQRANDEGLFIQNKKDSLNFGFSEASYWICFSLNGESDSELGWFLQFSYPAIDLYQIYIPDESGQYKKKIVGDSVPFHNWIVPFFRPTIPLGHELPLKKPIYINVRTTGVVNITGTLFYSPQLIKHMAMLKLGLGIYYGIMAVLMIYNLFLYLSFRDKNYLLYTIFIFAFALAQATYNGLGFQYFWPSWNWFANFSYPFFLSILFIPMILFAKSFLATKKNIPHVNTVLNILLGSYVFISISYPIVGMKIASSTSTLFSLLTATTIYFAAIFSFIKGQRSARFFLLAWTVYLAGLIIMLLKMLGILPHNFITEYGVQIGSAVEGILLSFALADRINILKNEKQVAQSQVIVEIKKSEALKSQFLEKAEKLVEERTLELTKAQKELEKLARIDKLTSLYNRRVFDEVFEKEFSLAKRTQTDFSLLVIDVDLFKKFNDRYGHQKGDECLQAIATCMEKNAQRITDTLARYGGEEFAIILTETDSDNALLIAERIRKDIESLGIPHQDSPFERATISLGLATLDHTVSISHEQFFTKADDALYKAKEKGRNQVFMA